MNGGDGSCTSVIVYIQLLFLGAGESAQREKPDPRSEGRKEKRELASAAYNTPRPHEQVHPEILIQPQTAVQAWHRGGLQGLNPVP
jgi:hypothetical protein